jgi:transcriptional regulator with XRE-family HTH domain
MDKLGGRIKYYRQQANMTQQDLADKLSELYKSGTAISLIESNARGVDANDLPAFAEALGVNVATLLGEQVKHDFSTALRSDASLTPADKNKILDFYNYVKNGKG